jgi:hypothetical protein
LPSDVAPRRRRWDGQRLLPTATVGIALRARSTGSTSYEADRIARTASTTVTQLFGDVNPDDAPPEASVGLPIARGLVAARAAREPGDGDSALLLTWLFVGVLTGFLWLGLAVGVQLLQRASKALETLAAGDGQGPT